MQCISVSVWQSSLVISIRRKELFCSVGNAIEGRGKGERNSMGDGDSERDGDGEGDGDGEVDGDSERNVDG